MARRRRNVETFGLSFLDVICCGFGAVILFYTIISAQSGLERMRQTEDLTSEVNRLEEEVLEGTRNLVVLRNTLEKTESETASAAARIAQILAELEAQRRQMAVYDETSLARRQRIEKLMADVRSLEERTQKLRAAAVESGPQGAEARSFRQRGGDRRYITGLRMRGKHILILVDASASMLHQDLVNIILLRNSSDTRKREAAKWRRAVDTVDWLSTQLPAGSQYQIYVFNTQARAVLTESHGRWQSSDDAQLLERNVEALRSIVPTDGTSLINAFTAIRSLDPLPDQIILITDGLPTQGRSAGRRKYIDARGRVRLFDEAIRELPDGVPVDVVLLPMMGDLPAAHRFWQLARRSDGVLLMPSKDWP